MRRAVSSIFVVLALSSCVSSPPEHLAIDTHAQTFGEGHVTVLSYFTRGQMRDGRWQARLMHSDRIGNMCKGEPRVRREVRWFPATETSRQPCAAIISTSLCPDASPQAIEAVEKARREYLAAQSYGPIEPGCGEKDSLKRRAEAERKKKDGLSDPR
jgi:hypothetical protein